jgi:hypothetical protein
MRLRAALAAIALLLLCSCGASSQARLQAATQAAFAEGCRRGAADALTALERQAKAAKREALKAVRPKLSHGALAAALMTLFGDKLAEMVRRKLATAFKLEAKRQAKLVIFFFWTAAALSVAILCGRHGFAPLPPLGILLGTSAWHLHASYVPALLQGDKSKRVISLGKIKALLFLILVIAMVFELLAPSSRIALGAG